MGVGVCQDQRRGQKPLPSATAGVETEQVSPVFVSVPLDVLAQLFSSLFLDTKMGHAGFVCLFVF